MCRMIQQQDYSEAERQERGRWWGRREWWSPFNKSMKNPIYRHSSRARSRHGVFTNKIMHSGGQKKNNKSLNPPPKAWYHQGRTPCKSFFQMRACETAKNRSMGPNFSWRKRKCIFSVTLATSLYTPPAIYLILLETDSLKKHKADKSPDISFACH